MAIAPRRCPPKQCHYPPSEHTRLPFSSETMLINLKPNNALGQCVILGANRDQTGTKSSRQQFTGQLQSANLNGQHLNYPPPTSATPSTPAQQLWRVMSNSNILHSQISKLSLCRNLVCTQFEQTDLAKLTPIHFVFLEEVFNSFPLLPPLLLLLLWGKVGWTNFSPFLPSFHLHHKCRQLVLTFGGNLQLDAASESEIKDILPSPSFERVSTALISSIWFGRMHKKICFQVPLEEFVNIRREN